MTAGEFTGTAGVTLLLLAFSLNLGKRLSSDSLIYLGLNFTGAALACLSSYLIKFWPFVVLEGVWMLASLILLIKRKRHA